MNRKRGHGYSLSAVTFWLFAEALFTVLLQMTRELRKIMALVSVDDSLLTGIVTDLGSIDTAVEALVTAGAIPDGTPELQAVRDAVTKIQTDLGNSGVVPAPTDPTTDPSAPDA